MLWFVNVDLTLLIICRLDAVSYVLSAENSTVTLAERLKNMEQKLQQIINVLSQNSDAN